MATLTTEERAAAHADFERELSELRQPTAATRADIRAAIDAADAWITENLPLYEAAIPEAVRAKMTSAQIAALALIVLRRRVMGV